MTIKPTQIVDTVATNIERFRRPSIKNAQLVHHSSEYRVDPTTLEDLYEPMSFELRMAQEEDEIADILRVDELYDPQLDYEAFLYQKYNYDDVELSDTSQRSYGHQPIDPKYYPDRSIPNEIQHKLNFINLVDTVIPSSFNSFNHEILADTFRRYAHIAVEALDFGTPMATVIRTIEKSILKKTAGKKGIPEERLYQYLLNHPNDRKFVVSHNNLGDEIFDNTACTYLRTFRKIFPTAEDGEAVLAKCKVLQFSGDYRTSPEMCEIVCLLRKNPTKQKHSYVGKIEDAYDKNKLWSDEESKLLEMLKAENGRLDASRCKAAKYMLTVQHKPISYIINNLQTYTDRFEEIAKISERIDSQFYINDEKFKTNIIDLLRKEFITQSNNFSERIEDSRYAKFINALLDEETPSIYKINKALKPLADLEQNIGDDPEFIEKVLEYCSKKEPNSKPKFNLEALKVLVELTKTSKKVNAGDLKILDKVKNSTNSEAICKIIRTLLDEGKSRTYIIRNIDNIHANNKEFEKLTKNIRMRFLWYDARKIISTLESEFEEARHVPGITLEQCPRIQLVKQMMKDRNNETQIITALENLVEK